MARYFAPLTLLAAIVFAPALLVVMRLPVPGDASQAKIAIRFGWEVAGLAWIGQLVLVGGVAPAVRGVVVGARLSQLRAFSSGLAQLLRAIAPCAVVVAAVLIGSIALIVPGLLLLVMLSLTGASTARGLAGQLAESVAVVRTQLKTVAIIVGAMILADVAIAMILHGMLLGPVSAKPTPHQLVMVRGFVRAVTITIVVLSPLPAILLATIRSRRAASPS